MILITKKGFSTRRTAIAQHQEFFTLSEPPKLFGKGVSSE